SPEDMEASYTSGYDAKRQLYEAADDDTIKGVVLEINSGGGTIYGARAIADGVEHYRSKTHRPVYAHIQGMAASGALWAAVSADKVIADYGSSIGSIGVIAGPFKYYDKVVAEGNILTQNGIESVIVSAGKSKDIGDPYRRLTEEELAALRQGVNNDYDMFLEFVSQRRGIATDTIRNQIGAMIYDNKTAKSHKLIDDTNSKEGAYDALAQAAQLNKDDYEVIRVYTEVTQSEDFASEAASGASLRQSGISSSCTLSQVRLAYHGDITRLCD
ncbi:MAG TPA: S49 family peptidase, partial [Candidatus Saccharimonadales bacterium]